jgi:hypothetical protein
VKNIISEKYEDVVYSDNGYLYAYSKDKYTVFDYNGNKLYSFKDLKSNLISAYKKYYITYGNGYHLYNSDSEELLSGNNIYGIATAPDQYVVYQNGNYASASLSPESRAAVEQLFASCSQGGPTPHNYTNFRSNGSEKYGGTILEPGGNRYK